SSLIESSPTRWFVSLHLVRRPDDLAAVSLNLVQATCRLSESGPGRRRFARYESLGGRRMEGPKPAQCPSRRASRFPNRCNPQSSRLATTACLRGQVCGTSARAEWPALGSRGTAGWGAAGAFVVALAARRPWFCCHRLFAVLLRFGRRRTGLAEKAAL